MGFDIDQLIGKSVETEVELAGQTAVVYYDPNVLTKDRIEGAERGDEQFLDFFCALVVDWDVTQGGSKVALKPDALGAIPIVALRAIFMHILRESSAGTMGKVSSASSRRRVPQDRKAKNSSSRSGIATSRQHATSG